MKILYPVVVLTLFTAFLIGFKHERTISEEEKKDIDKLLEEEQHLIEVN